LKLGSVDENLAKSHSAVARLRNKRSGKQSPTFVILPLTASGGSVDHVWCITMASVPRRSEIHRSEVWGSQVGYLLYIFTDDFLQAIYFRITKMIWTISEEISLLHRRAKV
jgi:hypothetical protein